MDDAKAEERRSGDTQNRDKDPRGCYEKDRARIIHSAAFRRLQAKTQVLGISEGDFHRTRLTHSMEVAQIARSLTITMGKNGENEGLKNVFPPLELIEAIGFCHDLGHPPFGHSGEKALNFMMANDKGFEGNGQSLRILSKLEARKQDFGLDLTRRTLLGILKYPIKYTEAQRKNPPEKPENRTSMKIDEWEPPKCYLDTETEIVDWILSPFSEQDKSEFIKLKLTPSEKEHGKSKYKSLDASIMELADDISYAVHDFEDGITLKLIKPEHWNSIKDQYDAWKEKTALPESSELENHLFEKSSHDRKYAIGSIINSFVTSAKIEKKGMFDDLLLDNNAIIPEEGKTFLKALKNLTKRHIIDLQAVQTVEYRGRHIMMMLFDALSSDPTRLLNQSSQKTYEAIGNRAICDYIAGMTDEYATKMYERLFVPREGNIFDKL